jgi:hypothetical protein
VKKHGSTLLILVCHLLPAAARGPFTAKLSQTHFRDKFLIVQSRVINRTIKNAFAETFDL